ncbi:precorrin-2 C(20)-methyltransferase [Desulfovibrio litoralis]|uniref:Precorrin-2 C20-methyltransferase n=1 Tax=Desulfovibrio litoralis DSM 11393 TaxID=1121455 RepID=A0A1M7S708_9BACT|nr:precorrin-2 C(20)-methyltransferase [Desulfovibrio litoralis]SHN54246.1 precorrin-2 C20-methyltransferase [Desulfovibrio litoralis DSM 11393]
MNKLGILYGVGVGPGDPELLTLRAVKTLSKVDVILAAASSKNDYSIAYEIAKPHLSEHIEILRLNFPMTRDKLELQKAWEENARHSVEILKKGKNVAFLTLGDPLIFSTFGYLLTEILKILPELELVIEPGITSFQEAAAVSKTMLCSAGENFLLLSGINEREKLQEALAIADNSAILKAYKNLPTLLETIEEKRESIQDQTGLTQRKDSVFVSRLGFSDQKVESDLETLKNLNTPPHYLSLLLLGKRFKTRF